MADLVTADEAGRIPIPEISPEIVAWLQATHPQKVIQRGEDLDDAFMRAGFQQCIDVLAHYASLQKTSTQPGADAALKDELYYDVPDPDKVLPEVVRDFGVGRQHVHRHTRNADRPV